MSREAVVIERLANIHPALRRERDRCLEEWLPEKPSDFNLLSELGRAVADDIDVFGVHELRAVAEQLEWALGYEEDQALGEAICTGFLEAFLHQWDEHPECQRFVDVLGPRAMKYCQAYNDFWGVQTPLRSGKS